ncbi:hypothetical protein DBV05_g9894 [Lasiodiplodia theobromae]|uniref:Uncharacterized protein n=1 Tax=Lasiodiplodia theobromae TaxID=45133 RepID=A0A5N5D236_9PEZI|nr:hypothetical protein DBV05_g9894 [Lasiodiplodia theobromae]
MLVIVAVLFGTAITGQKNWGIASDISSLWKYGLGGENLWATAALDWMRKMGGISDTAGFFAATLFANMFQIVFSALYLLYNNLITVLLVAAEWNDFISERKSLRVSAPLGMQRGSYFLSLPYSFSLPLIVCSGLLHWLISQSVFVIQTVGYTSPDFHINDALGGSIVGYSSLGILLSMMLGGTMVLALVLLGAFKKYTVERPKDGSESPPYPMPLVSTCSAAISAACHAHPDDTDVGFLPVRWGYVSDLPGKGPGRLTFTTARDVWYPSGEDILQGLMDRANESASQTQEAATWPEKPAPEIAIQNHPGSLSRDGGDSLYRRVTV